MTWVHWVALVPACMWASLLLLPWRPWGTRERLEAGRAASSRLDDVVVLIPARDEAASLPVTLAALLSQGQHLKVVVVDDQSSDDTASVARSLAGRGVVLVEGEPLPDGWTGKAWAQHQAEPHLDRPLVLLLDADIELDPGLVCVLRERLVSRELGFVSLMAELSMSSGWEKLLMPPFVYFFKLIYPFELSARAGSSAAAAAGGCILLRREALHAVGGFESLRDALIDDCRLAALVKSRGYRTWIGLTRSAHSRRGYAFGDVWRMVQRTAFTQLRYSGALLMLCTVSMLAAFLLPIGLLLLDDGAVRALAVAALIAQWASYLPTLVFYRRPLSWCFTLPVAACLFLSMTWGSALLGGRAVELARAHLSPWLTPPLAQLGGFVSRFRDFAGVALRK